MGFDRRVTMRHSAIALAIAGLFSQAAVAGPQGGTVQAGAASIATTGATTTINQSSPRAVIDWSSFSIGAGETVRYNQPNAQAATLNRVTGNQVSSLQGALTANGGVWLINPNGVLIGNAATINVGSFVASTANISTNDFMRDPGAANGRYTFNEVTPASATGSIVNQGTITVADGGLVALVGPAVRNTGTIMARLGKIALGSANIFTLDLFGDNLIRLGVSDRIAASLTDVTGNPVTAQVTSTGQLSADGGKIVLMSVPAAAGVVNEAINLSGIARAQTVNANAKGEILLLAAEGKVSIGGTVDLTAPSAGTQGGKFQADGTEVHVVSGAKIDASGAGRGGLIYLGAEMASVAQGIKSTRTRVDNGAQLLACGSLDCQPAGGDGGDIRLYSSSTPELAGVANVSRFGEVNGMTNQGGGVNLAGTGRIIGLCQTGCPDSAIPATLRPNGTLGLDGGQAAVSTDTTLTSISVTFPPVAGPGGGDIPTGGGGPNPSQTIAQIDVAANANRLQREGEREKNAESDEQAAAGLRLLIVPGGPGVGRLADLGRQNAVSGASTDVFGPNHHVLVPAGGTADTPTIDYLCRTPFGLDGCSARR